MILIDVKLKVDRSVFLSIKKYRMQPTKSGIGKVFLTKSFPNFKKTVFGLI